MRQGDEEQQNELTDKRKGTVSEVDRAGWVKCWKYRGIMGRMDKKRGIALHYERMAGVDEKSKGRVT